MNDDDEDLIEQALGKPADDAERRRQSTLRSAIDGVARQSASHAASEAGTRAGRRAAIGYFALIFVLLIGATIYSRQQESHLRSGLMATCKRINYLRVDESNRNAQVFYKAFYTARERERQLAHHGTSVDQQAHQKSVAYITQSLDALRWTPKTDCDGAVDHASSYEPPDPKPFTKRYLDLSVVPK